MKKKSEKKKMQWQQYIAMVFFMLIGGVCGVLMGQYLEQRAETNTTVAEDIFALVCLFISMYAFMLIQIIIHESGHLVFGLFTGYKFSSFRIFSFMWVKENGKVRLRRLSIAGTGGQCLMSPPDMVEGRIPVVLYNLGGSFMNILALLHDKDIKNAEKIKLLFEKCAKSYPYPNDVQSERELMEIAEKVHT